MNASGRSKRLTRITRALDRLRDAELARQADANTRMSAAKSAAAELDDLDLSASPSWELFPLNWLKFRARLDAETLQHAETAKAAAERARRMEKASEHFSAIQDELEAVRLAKAAADEIFEFIARSADAAKPALGKFSALEGQARKK